MPPKNICIVEDDPVIRSELSTFLSNQGYTIAAPTNFEQIVQGVLATRPHLVLLDLQLPGTDGNYICREIRKSADIPIIVVTSKNTPLDELMSMNVGADDYVTKPYHPAILLARIEALLKRSYKSDASSVYTYKSLKLDISDAHIQFGSEAVELTKNEMKILHCFMKKPEVIISREELMEHLWSSDLFVDDNTLSVNVTRLRKKIESIGMENPIETKRGQGYIMR
ncbi:MAG: response regulator transcription factor [Bacilli bacterium]